MEWATIENLEKQRAVGANPQPLKTIGRFTSSEHEFSAKTDQNSCF